MKAAPKPPKNTHDEQQESRTMVVKSYNGIELKSFSYLLLCGELVQVIVAAVGEVGLENFPKQIPFQQVVGHG